MQETHYLPTERHNLPTDPGVYKFYNQASQLIYVGKAKNIRNRVNSYFGNQKGHLLKTRKMIACIYSLSFVLVNSEYEALMLESNLIKQNQPRYNVLLKDGKTFPYLCLTKGPYPRLISTRQRTPSLGHYFGPFTNTRTMEEMQSLIRELYPLRTCNYQLTSQNIQRKKFKVCLQYHIGNCLGPCVGLQSQEEYAKDIEQVVQLLKGNVHQVKKILKEAMLQAADRKDFKQAHVFQKRYQVVEHYQARALVIHPTFGNLDVIALMPTPKDRVFVSYLYVQKGMIIFAQTVEITKKLQETNEEIIAMALVYFREKAGSRARIVLSHLSISPLPDGVRLVEPQLGDKRKLVDLALKNVFFFQREYLNKKTRSPQDAFPVLKVLQKDLGLRELPSHIECFDNANLQGTNPVAGMVCFKNGRPFKKNYRHFHIKTVVGPDDFASMAEIVARRYKRMVEMKEELPKLIVVDGGKGQLSAAVGALKKMGLKEAIPVIAIAKKLEIIYVPGDAHPLYFSKKSPSLKLLQRIRNAAHDFAISFHRSRRRRQGLHSQLETIPSIGPKTIGKLLTHFGSLASIKAATLEELKSHIGARRAEQLLHYLRQEA